MRDTLQRFIGAFAASLTVLALLRGAATADPIYRDDTVSGDTNWFTANNWFNATTSSYGSLPTASDDAYIGDTGYLTPAIVDIAAGGEGGAMAGTLILGNGAGTAGTLNLLPTGSLSVASFLIVGGGGTGTFHQSGGSLQAPVTGVGVGDYLNPDVPGSGTFDQTGGTHAVLTSLSEDGASALVVGGNTGSTGAYSLTGANAMLQAPSTLVGFLGGDGTFTHTAGTHLITSDYSLIGSMFPGLDFPGLFLGFGVTEDPGDEGSWIGLPSTGSYSLTGGTLTITRAPASPSFEAPIGAVVWLGTSGTGALLLGDANGTGVLNETGQTDPGVSLFLRPFPSGGDTATLQGWGTVALTGVLLNNGRVIADGYGQDRDLDLRSFSLVASEAGTEYVPLLQSDLTQAGWYAQNHGRLLLPTSTMDMGDGSYAVLWGTGPLLDGSDVGAPVNSLAILLEGILQEPPTFSIALLAPDRAEVPAGTVGNILGIWDIQMTAGELPEGTTAGLAIRYDDALAAAMGLSEDDLGLFHFTNGQWYDITAGLDTANNVVAGSWDVLSLFAVGHNIHLQQQGAIPEPASLTLLGLGALALLRRRRRPSA